MLSFARLRFRWSRHLPLVLTSLCPALGCDDAEPERVDNNTANSIAAASDTVDTPSASSSNPSNTNTSGAPVSGDVPPSSGPSNTSGMVATQTVPSLSNSGSASPSNTNVGDDDDPPNGAGGSGAPPNATPSATGGAQDGVSTSPASSSMDPDDPPSPTAATQDAGIAPEDEEPPSGSATSAGCGAATSLESGSATIDVDGTQREYILALPSDYDPSRAYKLVFGLHWLGGQASDVATGGTVGLGNYYGLEELADGSAIFVAPNGIENGWPNTGGRDIAFMKALIALFSDELCIDLDRIFSVGFSYGGMMSFAIACEMADVFRAIAPLSGALYSGCGDGTEPIAMWGAHGISDEVVPIGDGRSGLQEVLDRNHCTAETSAIEPSPCVSYAGCDEGYPVTWCEFDGGHSPQQWQTQPIWDFFSQF